MNPIRTALVALVSVALVALGSPPAGAEPPYDYSDTHESTTSAPDGTAAATAAADQETGNLAVHAEARATGLAGGLGYMGWQTRAGASAALLKRQWIGEGEWDIRAVISEPSASTTIDNGDFALPYGLEIILQDAYAGLSALLVALYFCFEGCESGPVANDDHHKVKIDQDTAGDIVLSARVVVPEGQSGRLDSSVHLNATANVHGEASAEASASGVLSEISVHRAS